jgi:hypothetical protein
MNEVATGLSILGGAIGGAKILEKILGPTSEYIGNNIKDWTEKKVNNVSNIFKNAEKKLSNKINEPGNVSPKVLKSILNDGAWSEEEIQIEYIGGVLASSRGETIRDDRGSYFMALVSRLTNYQLRTHYLFYHCLKKHFDGQIIKINRSETREKMEIFIPMSLYLEVMEFSQKEIEKVNNLAGHSIFGIQKEDLIAADFRYGKTEFLKEFNSKINAPGIMFKPTYLGVELMMWAYGFGQNDIEDFFSKEIVFNNELEFKYENSFPTHY